MTAYTSFEELEIGRVFPDPPANFQITEAQVAAYLMATGDESTVYREDPSRPIPPMFAAVYMLDAIAHLRNPPGGIHTKQRFTFHQPVHIGDRLTIEVRILDKFVKKRRNHVVMTLEARNQAGDLVTTAEIARIWGKET